MEMRNLRVCDVDPYMKMYSVVLNDRVIGEKSFSFGYLKAPYNKNGRLISITDRMYKGTPPWMNYEIVEIGPNMKLTVKKEED